MRTSALLSSRKRAREGMGMRGRALVGGLWGIGLCTVLLVSVHVIPKGAPTNVALRAKELPAYIRVAQRALADDNSADDEHDYVDAVPGHIVTVAPQPEEVRDPEAAAEKARLKLDTLNKGYAKRMQKYLTGSDSVGDVVTAIDTRSASYLKNTGGMGKDIGAIAAKHILDTAVKQHHHEKEGLVSEDDRGEIATEMRSAENKPAESRESTAELNGFLQSEKAVPSENSDGLDTRAEGMLHTKDGYVLQIDPRAVPRHPNAAKQARLLQLAGAPAQPDGCICTGPTDEDTGPRCRCSGDPSFPGVGDVFSPNEVTRWSGNEVHEQNQAFKGVPLQNLAAAEAHIATEQRAVRRVESHLPGYKPQHLQQQLQVGDAPMRLSGWTPPGGSPQAVPSMNAGSSSRDGPARLHGYSTGGATTGGASPWAGSSVPPASLGPASLGGGWRPSARSGSKSRHAVGVGHSGAAARVSSTDASAREFATAHGRAKLQERKALAQMELHKVVGDKDVAGLNVVVRRAKAVKPAPLEFSAGTKAMFAQLQAAAATNLPAAATYSDPFGGTRPLALPVEMGAFYRDGPHPDDKMTDMLNQQLEGIDNAQDRFHYADQVYHFTPQW